MTKRKAASAATPRILNCLPSPDQETDWTFGAAVMAGVADTDLPEAVDRRETWWDIGDQKDTGSCVGWATADGLLRYHFVKAGWIGEGERLSPRFTWMAAKELDEFVQAPTTFIEPEGTSLKAALDVSRKYGVALEADLPFSGGLFPGPAQVFYNKAAQLKIASYTNLGPSPMAWRRWLANNGPILVRLVVDRTWTRATSEPVLRTYRPETGSGGHAAVLVGYTPEGFLVRNSWGTGWGDGGYAFATDAYAAAAFGEAYGVSIGGAAKLAATTADSIALTRKALPETWTGDEADFEALVLETAGDLRGRPFAPLDRVSLAFPDGRSFGRFLEVLEQRLDAGDCLTSAAKAKLEQVRQGFFDELADWVRHRVGLRGTAATSAADAGAVATITRSSPDVGVIINGVRVLKGIDAQPLKPGANTLMVHIKGKPGDSGTAALSLGGTILAQQTATIPNGLKEDYSALETFDA